MVDELILFFILVKKKYYFCQKNNNLDWILHHLYSDSLYYMFSNPILVFFTDGVVTWIRGVTGYTYAYLWVDIRLARSLGFYPNELKV